MRGLRVLGGEHDSPDTNVMSFFLLERILVTEDWRHMRLRARFVKFLTRNRKGKAEIAARAAAGQPKVLRRRQR